MVWGRLDAASLKRDFLDARRELVYIHGRGLFAKRKGVRKPDNATAKVIRILKNAVPEFARMKEFADWVKNMLDGGHVAIKSTGQEVRFSGKNVRASVKRSHAGEHRH